MHDLSTLSRGDVAQLREAVALKRKLEPYRSFAQLLAAEREGATFRTEVDERGSAIAIIAPHGGNLEPGTSEIAAMLSASKLSLYRFESMLPEGDERLHITSARFDDPRCQALLDRSLMAVTVHGCNDDVEAVYIGGRNRALVERLVARLLSEGLPASLDELHPGRNPMNLCNRAAVDGIQLEFSRGLRRTFSSGPDSAALGASRRGLRTIEVLRNELWEAEGWLKGMAQRRGSD